MISIVDKTVGINALLKEAFSKAEIDCAFIFGSFARGKEQARSDVDLIVVGRIRMKALSILLSKVQKKIGREINPHIYTVEEFKQKISEKNHFLTTVLQSDIREILGKIDEYK